MPNTIDSENSRVDEGLDRLHCSIRLLPSPHSDPGRIDLWGEVALTIESTGGGRELLLGWQWDLVQLVDFFSQSVETLCQSGLNISGERPALSESLGEALDRLRDRDFEDDEVDAIDRWTDEIYSYYSRHCLWFALRGARIPDIIVGCHRGAGEISLSVWQSEQVNYEENPIHPDAYVKPGGWVYRFRMHDFLVGLRSELHDVLTEWLAGDRSARGRRHIQDRLDRLPTVPCGECCADVD